MRMPNVWRAGGLAPQARPGEGAAFACVIMVATLTGCGKIDGDRSTAAMPSRKAGLWEQVLTRDGKPGRLGVLTLCVDASTDRKMGVFGRHFGKGDCERTITRDAERVYHFISTCSLSNGTVVKSMGTASGDFGSGYRIHSEVNIAGAPISPMNGMHVIDIHGRYEGACPATMRPGEVVLGSGLKVDIDNLPQIASAASGG